MKLKDITDKKIVVTVGRQFGSGGRELGKALADSLGIKYYDKELLTEAARHAGVAPEFFDRKDERAPSFLSGLYWFNMGCKPATYYSGSNSISDDSLYTAQSDLIKRLAEEESCVIVGRTADYILRDNPNVVNVFVHAPVESCIERILRRQPELGADGARQLANKTNKLRSNYYNFYTDKRWGDAPSYHLTFDSSLLTTQGMVDVVTSYISGRFGGAR
ncbi:MAG: cytidylate kinase-like family protein [Muribaculaceae bacterium]|nr:cytidylate kinase-like family protein [Muribaculaceae bacterium]